MASSPSSTGSNLEEGGFSGDSLIKAELAFLCIYTLLYLAFTVFSIPILLRNAKSCLGVYLALTLSLLFETISSIASIFSLVVRANGIGPSVGKPSFGPTMVALAALIDLFSTWTLALLFLSICLLIRDRHVSLHKARVSRAVPAVYYVLFALLLVFGTVYAALYMNYQAIIYIGNRLVGHTVLWVVHIVLTVNDLWYTFESLWYLSSVVTLLYAVYVYREMRRLSLKDKVLHTVLFGVMPAYILMAIQGMIFTILTSPSGIKLNPFDRPRQIEGINLASVLLSNLFHVIMYGIMLGLGFNR